MASKTSLRFVFILFATIAAWGPSIAWADSGGGGHADPVAPVILGLVVILFAAKIGGDLASRVGQPSVLGELVAGLLIGNLSAVGISVFEPIKTDVFIDMFARVGVLVLLFQAGLESTVGQMLKVGMASFVVATLGVVAPFALGWGVAMWLLPEANPYVGAFLGAALTATSVGITARVLRDLKKSDTNEARIILGAAVIDDVFGLVILAVVSGVIVAADLGTTLSAAGIAWIVGKAGGFLIGALAVGVLLSRPVFSFASKLRAQEVLLALGLATCFIFSWAAGEVGLAPIVGAFAAGLVLEDVHYRDFVGRGEHPLEELIHPIASFLVPIFFVLMGMKIDVRVFSDKEALGLSAVLIVAAILGKQACYFGARDKVLDRLSIAIGMVPRGEVGLIFASIGAEMTFQGKPLLSPAVFSALVVMVIVTTMVTPPALKWSLGRARSRAS